MKRISLLFFLLITLFTINPDVLTAQTPPPDVFIINHKWPADMEPPFGKYMQTKIQQTLLKEPASTNEVAVLHSGDKVRLITSELYTYPSKYPVYISTLPPKLLNALIAINGQKILPRDGEYIYLLSYTGEGLYMAWYENQILYVPGDGIQGLAVGYRGGDEFPNWGDYRSSESPESNLWICLLRYADQKKGWVKYTSYENWQKFGYNIFSLN